MIDIVSLDDFCVEMHRLGAAIAAPNDLMPHCGRTTAAGYHVTTGPGGSYVLIYSERGVPEVVIDSPDPNVVMERVFVEVATGMADTAVANDQPPYDAREEARWAQLSEAEVREEAISFHLRSSRIQEDLLGKLNPDWRQRRSEWNAWKLSQTKEFFSEVMGD